MPVTPLSPILFLLYAAHATQFSKNTFGYADDLGILSIGDTLAETADATRQAYEEMHALGAAIGLPFSAEKTEIQHFSRKRKETLPAVTLTGVGDILPAKSTRWLGVWLDTKLTFKTSTSNRYTSALITSC